MKATIAIFSLQYFMQIIPSPFFAVFTVYSWRVVFAYYRVLACNGGVELDSDASGYGTDALNGGNGQDAHHEARMRMHRRHVNGSRRQERESRRHLEIFFGLCQIDEIDSSARLPLTFT